MDLRVLLVRVYRLKAWGEWNQTSTVFEKSYFGPRMQISFEFSFFLDHLLVPSLGYYRYIFRTAFACVTLLKTVNTLQEA